MKIVFSFFILFLATSICAQVQTYNSKSTSFPNDSRYELIQSELAAKLTFKVDKYSGDVYQLVLASDQSLTWQLIIREKSRNDKQNANRVNYQLFTSGLAVKYTFLLNLNSGATWQLSEDSEQGIIFFALIK